MLLVSERKADNSLQREGGDPPETHTCRVEGSPSALPLAASQGAG